MPLEDPCVFTTYERFTDCAAMDRHNGSAVVARSFGIAKPLLDGAVTLVTSSAISAKDREAAASRRRAAR
jgi:quinol monooxygenase YgiN